jgi:hypothetical protein
MHASPSYGRKQELISDKKLISVFANYTYSV